MMSLQKWENNLTDVNDQFNEFYWRLDGCVQRHAPIKKLSKKELQATSKPLITREVENLIKHRDKLFKRKKKQPYNEDISSLYNQFRNRVNREVKKSKKTYYKTYFEDSKSDIKKTWEGIKSLINNSNSSLKISQLRNNGRIIDDPEGIAAGLNNFFVNVGPNTERQDSARFRKSQSM